VSRRWGIAAPLIALSPLLAYRLLEYLAMQLSSYSTSISEVMQHTVPPMAMLVISLALWRSVPPLPRKDHGTRSHVGRSVAVGMLLGTLAALVNLLLMLATETRDGHSGMASIAMISPGGAALVAHVVVLAPVAEEVAFRGLIYRIFRRNMMPITATILSALIFGLMHVAPGKAVWAFFLGLIAATAYEQTRSLLTPILIHALFNAVPIGVAMLRAKPDDVGPIWLVLAAAALIFTMSARSAGSATTR
jgi:membrane protease YdiL (CAAX protease family)